MICIKLKLFTIVVIFFEYTLSVYGYMLLSEQKPAIFAQQTDINFAPSQLITTLNDYARSSGPLANINWSALPCRVLFADHVNS